MDKRYWCEVEELCLGYKGQDMRPLELISAIDQPKTMAEAVSAAKKANEEFQQCATKKKIVAVYEYMDHETHEEFLQQSTL